MLQLPAKALTLIFVAGLLVDARAQEKSAPPPFVPGEVIVKFSAKSKASESSAAKAGSNEPGPALVSYVHSLSSELGVPVQAKRLGSGGTVILAIDQSGLLSLWAERLRVDSAVKEVRVMPSGLPDRPIRPAIQVQFVEGSAEEKLVGKLAADRKQTSSELEAIKDKFEKRLGCPLTVSVSDATWIQVVPDFNSITQDLAKQLAKRPDVEYAQPNFMRGRMASTSQDSPPIR